MYLRSGGIHYIIIYSKLFHHAQTLNIHYSVHYINLITSDYNYDVVMF